MGVLRRMLELLFGESTDELIRRYNHPLRKIAHFTLYALLGISLTGVFQHQKHVHKLMAAVICSAAFAALDELHQHFVEGRGPQLTDVLLDTTGAVTGALVMTGVLFLLGRALRGASRSSRGPDTAI